MIPLWSDSMKPKFGRKVQRTNCSPTPTTTPTLLRPDGFAAGKNSFKAQKHTLYRTVIEMVRISLASVFNGVSRREEWWHPKPGGAETRNLPTYAFPWRQLPVHKKLLCKFYWVKFWVYLRNYLKSFLEEGGVVSLLKNEHFSSHFPESISLEARYATLFPKQLTRRKYRKYVVHCYSACTQYRHSIARAVRYCTVAIPRLMKKHVFLSNWLALLLLNRAWAQLIKVKHSQEKHFIFLLKYTVAQLLASASRVIPSREYPLGNNKSFQDAPDRQGSVQRNLTPSQHGEGGGGQFDSDFRWRNGGSLRPRLLWPAIPRPGSCLLELRASKKAFDSTTGKASSYLVFPTVCRGSLTSGSDIIRARRDVSLPGLPHAKRFCRLDSGTFVFPVRLWSTNSVRTSTCW